MQVQLGCQTDNIGGANVLKRAPVVHERFPLDTEMVQVCNLWGGLIYLIAPSSKQSGWGGNCRAGLSTGSILQVW